MFNVLFNVFMCPGDIVRHARQYLEREGHPILSHQQHPIHGMLRKVVCERLTKLFLGFSEVGFIYPGGVIGIKGDRLEDFQHQASGRT